MHDFKDLHGNSIERLKFSVLALIWLKGKDRNVLGCNDGRIILLIEISSLENKVLSFNKLPSIEVQDCVKCNISEDMMSFGGEYVMIWNEYSRALMFFL